MKSMLRLRWLAGVVLLAIILLVAARLGDLPSSSSSPTSRVAALVACVLSPNPGEPESVTPAAATTEIDHLDCDVMRADPLRTPWISPC